MTEQLTETQVHLTNDSSQRGSKDFFFNFLPFISKNQHQNWHACLEPCIMHHKCNNDVKCRTPDN